MLFTGPSQMSWILGVTWDDTDADTRKCVGLLSLEFWIPCTGSYVLCASACRPLSIFAKVDEAITKVDTCQLPIRRCFRPIILRTVQEYFWHTWLNLTRSDAIRVIRPDCWVRSDVLSPTPHRDMRWQSHHIITKSSPGCRTAFLHRCLVLDRPNTSDLMVISMDLFSYTGLGHFHSRFS